VFGRPCQSVASLNDIEAVSAQSSPHSWRSNGPITEPFTGKLTGTPTVSGYLDADDGDGSTSSDDSSLSTEREFDADDDHHHMPIDELELALETSPSSRKRASTSISCAFKTPTKRQKLSSEFVGILTSVVVKKVPSHLIQPPKLMRLIAKMLDDTHKDSAMPLMCFSFPLASPHVLERLRQACVSIRDSQRGGPVIEEAGVWESVRALGCIDMHEHVSPILRRYHLVQLVKRRDEIYDEIVGLVAQSWSLAPRRGLRKHTAAGEMAGTKLADKLALERLMSEACPECGQAMTKKNAQHDKNFTLLQNQLSNGQN
jgi:hypothetical protein